VKIEDIAVQLKALAKQLEDSEELERQIVTLLAKISPERRAKFMLEQLTKALKDSGKQASSSDASSSSESSSESDPRSKGDRVVEYLEGHPGAHVPEIAKFMYPGVPEDKAEARTRTLLQSLLDDRVTRKGRGEWFAAKKKAAPK
jgi:hypothetical protein